MHTRFSPAARVPPIALIMLAFVLAGCGNLGGLLGGQPTPEPIILIATATPAPVSQATAMLTVAPSPPSAPSGDATATSAPPTAEPPTPTLAPQKILARVKERGYLICGTNADLPGFGFYDSVRQTWSGFDVDFCRAVAAAIFGDATKSGVRRPRYRTRSEKPVRRRARGTGRRPVSEYHMDIRTEHQWSGVRSHDLSRWSDLHGAHQRPDHENLEDLEGKVICVAKRHDQRAEPERRLRCARH
jgi:general L-amino acid transport system substrate-binding protein